MSVKRFFAWVRGLKPYRVYQSYSLAGGNLSAAGMSFQALFAVFAAVWVTFAILGIYLKGDTEVGKAIIAFINLQIPGLIGPNGIIDPASLYSTTTLTVSGAIALVVLAWTAIMWIDYARVAMHHMFGIPRQVSGYFYIKLGDILLALLYGLFVLLGALMSVVATSLFEGFLKVVGVHSDLGVIYNVLVRVAAVIGVLALDTVMLTVMIRVLSGTTIPWRVLWRGGILGGLALGAMKLAGASLLGGVTRNPLFDSVALFIGVLIWFNLTSRVMLLTAQWMATSMRDAGVDPKDVGWVVTKDSLRLGGFRAEQRARKASKSAS